LKEEIMTEREKPCDISSASDPRRGQADAGPAGSPPSNVVPLRAPEYSVGYGRPPVHSQFKPGRSGNPKGRPKGSHNVAAERRKFFATKIVLPVGGKKRRVSRIAALDWKQWHQAMHGDHRAAKLTYDNAKDLRLSDLTDSANLDPVIIYLDEVDARL
jgi:hypothetical protein